MRFRADHRESLTAHWPLFAPLLFRVSRRALTSWKSTRAAPTSRTATAARTSWSSASRYAVGCVTVGCGVCHLSTTTCFTTCAVYPDPGACPFLKAHLTTPRPSPPYGYAAPDIVLGCPLAASTGINPQAVVDLRDSLVRTGPSTAESHRPSGKSSLRQSCRRRTRFGEDSDSASRGTQAHASRATSRGHLHRSC